MRRSQSSSKKSPRKTAKAPSGSKGCTFQFFGTTWTLIRRKPAKKNLKLGGEVAFERQEIVINARYTGEQFLDYLMHELYEAAGMCSGSLYEKDFPADESIYLVTHDRLDMMAAQMRHAYDEIRGKVLGK